MNERADLSERLRQGAELAAAGARRAEDAIERGGVIAARRREIHDRDASGRRGQDDLRTVRPDR